MNMVCGSCSSIISGACNANSGNYSSIIGGSCNTVSGNYSAILGGCGNTIPAGNDWAGVFGCNVAAVAPCAFHANAFIAQNIPCYSSGTIASCPYGTIYADDTISTPYSPLFIKLI